MNLAIFKNNTVNITANRIRIQLLKIYLEIVRVERYFDCDKIRLHDAVVPVPVTHILKCHFNFGGR